MRTLAISQHLDLPEQETWGWLYTWGRMKIFRAIGFLDYTADNLTVCLFSHHFGPVEQKGDWNRYIVRSRAFGQGDAVPELAGICANAEIVHMRPFSCSCEPIWTFCCCKQFKGKKWDKMLVKLKAKIKRREFKQRWGGNTKKVMMWWIMHVVLRNSGFTCHLLGAKL